MSDMTPTQFRDYIESHRGSSGYEATACEAASRILRTFELRPECPHLYDAVKGTTDGEGDLSMADLGLTGFQWGWAVNAAKYCVGEPPVPNPAIIEIRCGPSRRRAEGRW